MAQQQVGHGLDIAGFGSSQTVHIHSFKVRLVMGEILGATEAGEPQQPIVALGQDGTYLAVGDGSQMRTHPLLRQMCTTASQM